jgi:hypothetical protein
MLKNIEELSWTNKYVNYIKYRKIGLKLKAKKELDFFLDDFNSLDKQSKRQFIDFVHQACVITDNYSLYLPENLNNYFKKEIDLWMNEEPLNPIPYKWSGSLDNLKKAIEIDPNDLMALEMLATRVIAKVSINQHDLKRGYPYDGDALEDILLIDFLYTKIDNLKDKKKKDAFIDNLKELKETAVLYV